MGGGGGSQCRNPILRKDNVVLTILRNDHVILSNSRNGLVLCHYILKPNVTKAEKKLLCLPVNFKVQCPLSPN